MTKYFEYGPEAIAHLTRHDKRLGEAIQKIGPLRRAVVPELFAALVNSIVGQQISTKAQTTIWARMTQQLGEVTPQAVDALTREQLQAFGITFKKADHIKSAAARVLSGELDLAALRKLEDAEVCRRLTQLDGVGVWTAEMLMIFSLCRPDIFSYGDLALHRGLCILYHHRSVSKALFERYRKRYSPYGTVASLYLWAIAGGAGGFGTEPMSAAPHTPSA